MERVSLNDGQAALSLSLPGRPPGTGGCRDLNPGPGTRGSQRRRMCPDATAPTRVPTFSEEYKLVHHRHNLCIILHSLFCKHRVQAEIMFFCSIKIRLRCAVLYLPYEVPTIISLLMEPMVRGTAKLVIFLRCSQPRCSPTHPLRGARAVPAPQADGERGSRGP